MAGSSPIPEKFIPGGENVLKSCPINMLSDDMSSKAVVIDSAINDVQKVPDGEDEEDEDDEEYGDDLSEEDLLAQMGYGKSEREKFTQKEHKEQYYDEEDEEDDNMLEGPLLAQMGYLKKEAPKHEPVTTPSDALKPLSALKGSREKEGKQATDCRVSWAPDVYDPPSSTERISTTSTQRHKNEVHKVKGLAGKNKQKMGGKGVGGLEGAGGSKGGKVGGSKGAAGGGMAGVKYKDKKQVKKKHGGSGSGSGSGRVGKYSNLDDC